MGDQSWANPWAFCVFHMWLGLMFHLVFHYVWFMTGRGASGGVNIS